MFLHTHDNSDWVSRIMEEYHEKSLWYPTGFFLLASILYICGLIGVGVSHFLLVKCTLCVIICLGAAKLFVIGHDACHGSFSPNARLNRVFAILALSMSYHIPSCWKFWHNSIHHVFTNELAKDFVWRPFSPREYDNLSFSRRLFERIYRHHSGVGLGLYYFREILIKKMIKKVGMFSNERGTRFAWGFCAVHCITVIWLIGSGLAVGGDVCIVALNILFGFVAPIISTCYAIGFVVYFNHTHPSVRWVGAAADLGFHERQIGATVFLRFHGLSEWLLPSGVMGHIAHHLDTQIPERWLPKAQERLVRESLVPITVDVWSWRRQREIMTTCQLYDVEEERWTGFNRR